MKGRYLAAWPVFIVGDDPSELTFTVAVDDERKALRLPAEYPIDSVVEDLQALLRDPRDSANRRGPSAL